MRRNNKGRFLPKFHTLKIERDNEVVVTVTKPAPTALEAVLARASEMLDFNRVGIRCEHLQFCSRVFGIGLTDGETALLRNYIQLELRQAA